MKATARDALGAPPALRDDFRAPRFAAGEVLGRLRASSVNPVDDAIAAVMLSDLAVRVV